MTDEIAIANLATLADDSLPPSLRLAARNNLEKWVKEVETEPCNCADGHLEECPHDPGQEHEVSLKTWAAVMLAVNPKEFRSRKPSGEAAMALPGSPKKLEIMRDRVSRREPACQPDIDLTYDGVPKVNREVHRGRNGRDFKGRLMIGAWKPAPIERKPLEMKVA
jgi:hypothetical protein